MKYLIIGRCGAGKDIIANKLKAEGLNGVVSYTTRPPRYAGDTTHTFINENEIDLYPERLAEAKINNHSYFTTKADFESSDYFMVEPKGLHQILRLYPHEKFVIIHAKADLEERRKRAIERASSRKKGALIFDERAASEHDIYSSFEMDIQGSHFGSFYPNVDGVVTLSTTNFDIDNIMHFLQAYVINN